MLGLPKSTEFNKRIPKQKFYDNLDITPALKKAFAEQINAIYWRNKISPTTLNIAAGDKVDEIEIFEIVLNNKSLDENVLKQIDKQIPYHIIFVLRKDDNYQIWIGYKESSQGKDAFKINKYFNSEWMKEESINLKLDGLDIDSIYDNYIRQLGGEKLKSNTNENLKETIERDEKRSQLEKQIKSLQDKLRKEKQFNKQIEINKKIKELKQIREKFL